MDLSGFLIQSILQKFQFIADIDLLASHLNKQLSNSQCLLETQPRISWSGCIQFVMDKTKILYFSIFQSCCKIDFQNHSGKSIRHHGDFMVADPKLVPDNDAVTCGLPHHFSADEIHTEENKSHPLFPKLQLLAIHLSGKQQETETFQKKLVTSSVSPGET